MRGPFILDHLYTGFSVQGHIRRYNCPDSGQEMGIRGWQREREMVLGEERRRIMDFYRATQLAP